MLLVVLPLLILTVYSVNHVGGETIIDSDKCRKNSIYCPRGSDPMYASYCCATPEGYLTCCNPYVSIGLGISIPIVIITLMVVLVILIVCIIVKCRGSKYYRDSVVCNYRRVREEREFPNNAPPSYISSQGPPPAYTETEAEVHIRPCPPNQVQSALSPPPAPPPVEVPAGTRNEPQ